MKDRIIYVKNAKHQQFFVMFWGGGMEVEGMGLKGYDYLNFILVMLNKSLRLIRLMSFDDI